MCGLSRLSSTNHRRKPVLLFGSGGVMVEVHNDVALRRCPIRRREAQAMIAEVKGSRLLLGPVLPFFTFRFDSNALLISPHSLARNKSSPLALFI
jgi:hypothetical protein